MIRIDASLISTCVIKFQSFRDLAHGLLVIDQVRGKDFCSNPDLSVPRHLNDIKVPAPCIGINSVGTVRPPWDSAIQRNASTIFGVRHSLKMIWIAAITYAAKVIKIKSFRNWAVLQFPVPDVGQHGDSVAVDPVVSVGRVGPLQPASRLGIYFRLVALLMTGINIQHGLPLDVSARAASSNGSGFSASTRTNASTPFHASGSIAPLVVAFHEPNVTPGKSLFDRVGPVGDGDVRSTTAETFSSGVRSRGVIGVAPADFRGVSLQVSNEFALHIPANGLCRTMHLSVATAHTEARWIGRGRIRPLRLHDPAVVAGEKSRGLPIGMILRAKPNRHDRTTAARAQGNIVGRVHSISVQDHWAEPTSLRRLPTPSILPLLSFSSNTRGTTL